MTWTTDELTTLRTSLNDAITRLERESTPRGGLGPELGPHDETDVATLRIESLQDSAQAENSAAILEQTRHVIARLDAGLYGSCETCGNEIARARMEAYPRATYCVPCLS